MKAKPGKGHNEREMENGKPGNSELILYQTEDGKSRLEVRLEGETVWLSQKQLSELFQKDVRTISEHLRNVFDEVENGCQFRIFHVLVPNFLIANFEKISYKIASFILF